MSLISFPKGSVGARVAPRQRHSRANGMEARVAFGPSGGVKFLNEQTPTAFRKNVKVGE